MLNQAGFQLPTRPISQTHAIAPPIPTINMTNPKMSLNDKFTTVFIGAITQGVSDELLTRLLSVNSIPSHALDYKLH